MSNNTTGANTGKNKQTQEGISTEELKSLLQTLYKEPSKEANFEERFLHDFRDRVIQSAVCQPARTRLWENIAEFFTNFGRKKLAIGAAGSLSIIALAISSMVTWSDMPEKASTHVASVREKTRNSIDTTLATLHSRENASLGSLRRNIPSASPSSLDINVSPCKAKTHTYSGSSYIQSQPQKKLLSNDDPIIIIGSEPEYTHPVSWQ